MSTIRIFANLESRLNPRITQVWNPWTAQIPSSDSRRNLHTSQLAHRKALNINSSIKGGKLDKVRMNLMHHQELKRWILADLIESNDLFLPFSYFPGKKLWKRRRKGTENERFGIWSAKILSKWRTRQIYWPAFWAKLCAIRSCGSRSSGKASSSLRWKINLGL